MSIVKEEARKILDKIPDNATWDDIMYEFYVRQKIESSLEAEDAGEVVTHEEVEKKFPSSMKIIWTKPAVSDLESIRNYIARDSEYYAARMMAKIMKMVKFAAKNPLLGQVVDEFSDNDIRERYVQKYRLVYRVRADSIVVVAIIHGARDMGTIELDG